MFLRLCSQEWGEHEVTVTFDQNSNQFIHETKWRFVPNLKKFGVISWSRLATGCWCRCIKGLQASLKVAPFQKPHPKAYFTQLGNAEVYSFCNQTSMRVSYYFHGACGSAFFRKYQVWKVIVFQSHLSLFGEYVKMSEPNVRIVSASESSCCLLGFCF